jgi:hypothetical protein
MSLKKSKTLKTVLKYFEFAIVLAIALVFVIKFAGPRILRQYISYGIGDCRNIPILCMEPEEKLTSPEEDPLYLAQLVPQEFSRMSLSCPKGFTLIQELTRRPYYKKNKHLDKGSTIYLLYQEPGAFLKLYPDVRKQGVTDNYVFIERLMRAKMNKVNNIPDAFFVIMKSIFTPDIGNQSNAKMVRFRLHNKRGFINYNLAYPDNYFDCSVIDERDNFFKIYIKDKGSRLDLNKVFTIISTARPID